MSRDTVMRESDKVPAFKQCRMFWRKPGNKEVRKYQITILAVKEGKQHDGPRVIGWLLAAY